MVNKIVFNESGKVTGWTDDPDLAETIFAQCKNESRECSFSYICPEYTTHYKGRHKARGSAEMEYAFGNFKDVKTFNEIAEVVGKEEADNCCYQNYIVWVDALIMQGRIDNDGFVDFTKQPRVAGINKKVTEGLAAVAALVKSGAMSETDFRGVCAKFGANPANFLAL